MKILKNYKLAKIGTTVFIQNEHFVFSYTPPKDIVKEEFRKDVRYFGGLQCNFNEESHEYKQLETKLCEIAESVLKC